MINYIIIIFVVIIFYIRTLEYSIIVDDIRYYAEIKKGKYKWRRRDYKHFNTIRSFIKNLHQKLYGAGTFGLNTIWDHAFTTFLHAVTCALIYAVFGHTKIAFWTALLYAVNPINNQTAIWLNGRRYQIVIILSLLALLFKPYGIVFYLLTPIFQMTGFFIPILYWDISPLFILIMPVLAGLAYKKIKRSYLSRKRLIHHKEFDKWGWGRFKVIIKCYGFYFYKMIHPAQTLMNYPTLMKWGLTQKGNDDAYSINFEFWKGASAFALTGVVIYIPELRLTGIFILLGILQWSAIICVFQLLADRYISLVNIFIMYVLAYVFHTYLPIYALALCLALFAYYATQLDLTMRMYRSVEDFLDYQLFLQPAMARHRMIYADSFLKQKDLTRAWLLVEKGLRYDPDDFELLFRAAQCSASVSQLDKAEHFLQRAEQNYYLGQEKLQKERIKGLRNEIEQIRQHIIDRQRPISRQVKRAMGRKEKK